MIHRLVVVLISTLLSVSTYAQAPKQIKPWLGVAIDEGKQGVKVLQTIKDTPAAQAGILADDEIYAVGTTKVKTPKDLIKTVQSLGVGQSVDIHFFRAGKKTTKTLKLVARPGELELAKKRLLNQPAPKMNLEVAHGMHSGDIEKHKGKVVIVEFWATWCPGCRMTHNRLSQVAQDPDLVVLGITGEDLKTAKDYAVKTKTKFTTLLDKEHKIHSEWYVGAIPMIGVIDKKGVIRHLTVGGGEYLEKAIAVAKELKSK